MSEWDGRPENPERDGLHYITDAVAFWEAGRQKWRLLSRTRLEHPGWLAVQPWAEYRGPCPEAGELEARVAAARREGIEEAAAAAKALTDAWRSPQQRHGVAFGEAITGIIRRLLKEGER